MHSCGIAIILIFCTYILKKLQITCIVTDNLNGEFRTSGSILCASPLSVRHFENDDLAGT